MADVVRTALWQGLLFAAVFLSGLAGCQSSETIRRPASRGSVLDQAELALVRGQLGEARRGFADVLDRDPENLIALLGSARAYPDPSDVETSLDFYTRYRESAGAFSTAVHWEYCAVLVVATERALDSADLSRSLELSDSLISQSCKNSQISNLVLRAGLALAAREWGEKNAERALAIYLSLLPATSRAKVQNGFPAELDPDGGTIVPVSIEIRGEYDPIAREELRAEAYLGAVELLVESNRRGDALSLLEDALLELPSDRDLIRLMVATLAERSAAEFETGSSRTPAAGGRDGAE